jgi:hypothetical protein
VQRKQQVGECWVCVIFFAQVVVSEHLLGAGRAGGSGAEPPKLFFFRPTYFRRADIFSGRHITEMTYFRDHMILGGFSAHGFLPMVFYFAVKELGFWTNPGHFLRVLDVAGSYMYIVL